MIVERNQENTSRSREFEIHQRWTILAQEKRLCKNPYPATPSNHFPDMNINWLQAVNRVSNRSTSRKPYLFKLGDLASFYYTELKSSFLLDSAGKKWMKSENVLKQVLDNPTKRKKRWLLPQEIQNFPLGIVSLIKRYEHISMKCL